jgi:hypothetical protein
MRNQRLSKKSARTTFLAALAFISIASSIRASSWQGIEPLKTRREEVLKILGTPISESAAAPLTFKVMGGTASVSFVDQTFVRTKHLRPELEGTVLQIILQHENSSDTPESMKLAENHNFVRDEMKDALVFRNLKDGVVYTFLNGKLKTTRYTFSEQQISRARH